jgi:hypothetical protein
MSDDLSPDEGLSLPSTDSDVSRRADALESYLAALEHDAESDASPQRDRSSIVTSVADTEFARRLVLLGADIAPDADFAARLQIQIEQNIRDQSQVGDVARVQPVDNGSAAIAGEARNARRQYTARSLSHFRRLRPLWAAMAALLLLALLVALPAAQADVKRSICLGSVCLSWGASPHATTPAHRAPTPTPLPSVLVLAGRTTLTQARAQSTFPVRLPTYPPDLGQPAYVFEQDLHGDAVILVWNDQTAASRPSLSLFELSSGVFLYKFTASPIAVTEVHGQRAFWASGPYQVELQDGTYDSRWVVTGHALIWAEGSVTYRLETTLSLAEAVRIAESLR